MGTANHAETMHSPHATSCSTQHVHIQPSRASLCHRCSQPHMSKETLEFHHGKHHATYVNNLNKIAESDAKVAASSLEELINTTQGGTFNQAAQIWNHTFFWNCLAPNGGGEPTGQIADAINESFGSFDKFKEEFTANCVGHFGSGWAWLVKGSDGKLSIVQTHDAGCPLTDGVTPILTCDVWEHAYYIDYRNARPKHLEGWWSLVNWEFANKNLA